MYHLLDTWQPALLSSSALPTQEVGSDIICSACSFNDVDIALFSAGGSISKKFGPAAQKAGAIVSSLLAQLQLAGHMLCWQEQHRPGIVQLLFSSRLCS
jgi:hypothetical protein